MATPTLRYVAPDPAETPTNEPEPVIIHGLTEAVGDAAMAADIEAIKQALQLQAQADVAFQSELNSLQGVVTAQNQTIQTQGQEIAALRRDVNALLLKP